MKKLMLILSIIFLISCSSDDEDKAIYSEKQQKALAVLSGVFDDVAFEGSKNYISFENQYAKPLDIYKESYMDGSTILIRAQGECIWHTQYSGNTSQYNLVVPCYYEVSYDASYFILVYKGGEKDKTLFERFDLKVISPTRFTLKDKDLSLPYDFVKKER